MAAAGDNDDPEIYGDSDNEIEVIIRDPDLLRVQTLTDWFTDRRRIVTGRETLREIGWRSPATGPVSWEGVFVTNPAKALAVLISSGRRDFESLKKAAQAASATMRRADGQMILDELLIEAVDSRNEQMIKILIEAGADPNIYKQPSPGDVPEFVYVLQQALEWGNLEFIKWLVEHGANVNLLQPFWGGIVGVVAHGRIDILQYLRDQRASFFDDEEGRFVFLEVVCFDSAENQIEMLEWLLNEIAFTDEEIVIQLDRANAARAVGADAVARRLTLPAPVIRLLKSHLSPEALETLRRRGI